MCSDGGGLSVRDRARADRRRGAAAPDDRTAVSTISHPGRPTGRGSRFYPTVTRFSGGGTKRTSTRWRQTAPIFGTSRPTRRKSDAIEHSPQWAPDGQRLAFVAYSHDRRFETPPDLYTVRSGRDGASAAGARGSLAGGLVAGRAAAGVCPGRGRRGHARHRRGRRVGSAATRTD